MEKTILEGNRLIAYWMGARFIDNLWNFPCNNSSRVSACSEDMLAYHSDWNWLMPVVEKIEGMECVDGVTIINGCCTISGRYEAPPYIAIREGSKLETVWHAVVLFIKWYNHTTQQSPTPAPTAPQSKD